MLLHSPPDSPHPPLNKLIKEGAALAGNLIKYDIPALKSVLTEQKEDGTLSEEIVTVLVHDPHPRSSAPLPLYQLSITTYSIFQGHLRVLLDEKCYMLQITRLVSHLI